MTSSSANSQMRKCFSLLPTEAASWDLCGEQGGRTNPSFWIARGAESRRVLDYGIQRKNLYLVFCLLLGRTGKEAEGRESSPGGYRQSCSRAQSSEEGPRSEGESGNQILSSTVLSEKPWNLYLMLFLQYWFGLNSHSRVDCLNHFWNSLQVSSSWQFHSLSVMLMSVRVKSQRANK